jgi:putative spermidine/putrescine transport system ATP-binding protein
MTRRQTDGTFEELRLKEISRHFGRLAAVNKVSLSVRSGEFVALLGPSGCGKSTALGCVAGLIPLTAGEIWLDESRVDTLPTERRDFGMVFQNYALFPHLTVARNVAFGLDVRGVKRSVAAERVEWALSMVQLAGYEDHYPAQLSGGQQQRVAIARALAPHPRIMLMDEPLSNLDAKLRLDMRSEIRRLHLQLGLTTLYVTHDQEEALSVADRIVVLKSGQVMQEGTPEEVYSRPANSYVADFMGYRNIVEFDVTEHSNSSVGLSGHGITLRGSAVGGVAGPTAVAAIRPDDVVFGDETSANAFPLRVTAAQYQGREMAFEGELPDGQILFARSTVRVQPGDTVAVSVPADRVLVYATDDRAAKSPTRAKVSAS